MRRVPSSAWETDSASSEGPPVVSVRVRIAYKSPSLHDPFTVPSSQMPAAASASARIRLMVRRIVQVRQIADGEGRMKILYVEDNDDNVYMLKNRLMRAGFTVVVATDGTQGIAMAATEQPDLILMDLTLPNMDGEEATRRIKADPATQRIPVIALTANAMAGDREKAL